MCAKKIKRRDEVLKLFENDFSKIISLKEVVNKIYTSYPSTSRAYYYANCCLERMQEVGLIQQIEQDRYCLADDYTPHPRKTIEARKVGEVVSDLPKFIDIYDLDEFIDNIFHNVSDGVTKIVELQRLSEELIEKMGQNYDEKDKEKIKQRINLIKEYKQYLYNELSTEEKLQLIYKIEISKRKDKEAKE